jgi:ribulose-5-phosphate 4-epimerase/fuculose-1-phosphate aldolase
MAQERQAMAQERQALARLITSSHILHHHKILTDVGTISIRNPADPDTFISTNLPAVLISSPSDLEIYHVLDASPVPRGTANIIATPLETHLPNLEIFIHSSIYARYPDVKSVAHVTTTDLVVYGLCDANGSMIRSVFNQAGFVDDFSPIFDPAQHRAILPIDHPETLKIDHPYLGAALADALSSPRTRNGVVRGESLPVFGVAFLRGNGAVVWSQGVEDTVSKVVNLHRNAVIQTAAMLQRNGSDLAVTYLSEREARDCARNNDGAIRLSWRAWAAETLRSALYHNELEDSI